MISLTSLSPPSRQTPQYLHDLEALLRLVRKIEKDIVAQLPDEILKEYWITSKHSPAAWRDVIVSYLNQEKPDERVLHLLDTVNLMTTSRINLEQAIREYALIDQPPNLTLAKTRRSS